MHSLTQPDYLDGKVTHIPDDGGVVQIEEEGTIHRCTVSTELAERLRPYINGPTIRGFGTAEWLRRPDGRWELLTFSIENFTPLDDKPLGQVLK